MASTALNNDEITEYFDSPDVVSSRLDELAQLIKASKHCVIYTGAGISTSVKLNFLLIILSAIIP
jgi:mono-ADP-ribosyltransferase sirtuin 6